MLPEWMNVDPADLPQHPSMLGVGENQFLYWWMREKYTGGGDILDLGAYLGGSAACLAKGLAENASVQDKPRIRSFDFFRYDPRFYPPTIARSGMREGDSTIPMVRDLLGNLASHVDFIEGDICQNVQTYSRETRKDRGIEFIFVDFTQNWTHHDFVIKYLYPYLIPNIGIVAHQDYLYVLCYWLHIFMERYADYFEVVSRQVAGGTAAWRLLRPLPSDATQSRLADSLSFAEMEDLIDRSLARYADEVTVGQLACAKMRFLFHTAQYDRARSYGANLRARYSNHEGLAHNINLAHDELEAFAASKPPPYGAYFNLSG